MENRFQYFLLSPFYWLFLLSFSSLTWAQTDSAFSKADIDSEFLEVGVNAGVVNIEDFPSELSYGFNIKFRATEDVFLQLNLVQAGEVDLSSAEKQGEAELTSGGSRDFLHYNMLVGYNIFQGEFFTAKSNANLSSLYFVGGVGETEFLEESNFTYILGLGYKVAFNRNYIFSFDVRQYLYESAVTTGGEEKTMATTHAGISFNYLF